MPTETEKEQEKHQHTNKLINETSPYLLQHAHNPVNWYPWGPEALQKAKDENKIILVSIGYSACHWCHVMEHECFEDEEVAKVMNEHFICIKVDREERPDVDQIYMDAIHLMNQRGGWPLNCFTTPDGHPFFGGTYFPKPNWLDLLGKVVNEYKVNPGKVNEFAARLAQGVAQTGLIKLNEEKPLFEKQLMDTLVENWAKGFDPVNGGNRGAPKFPIPNNYVFLMKYAHMNKDEKVKTHVLNTLDKIARGGIYDQIGGGFARYSVDGQWKAPHFEKMLYDNAQLVSLYADGYRLTKSAEYKYIIEESLEFVKRELTDESGAFYSALDADSDGEEGKFYVWKKDEVKEIITEDYDLFSKYYNINAKGLWEHGNYILLRDIDDESFCKKHKITIKELHQKREQWSKQLMAVRSKKIRPGLDDKSLTSWNALMLRGYVDAYTALNNPSYLKIAEDNAAFIKKWVLDETSGKLFHSYKEGKTKINAFLEDYCFTTEAFIALYEATFNEDHLKTAELIAEYTIQHFYNKANGMFFFTDANTKLLARKYEINDNVVPASNSSMANALFKLGTIIDKQSYKDIAIKMLNNVQDQMPSYGSGYSNWGLLHMSLTHANYEVAIVGKDALKKRLEMGASYLPNTVYAGAANDSELSLLENKYVEGATFIYVCQNKACQLPVETVNEAMKQLNE